MAESHECVFGVHAAALKIRQETARFVTFYRFGITRERPAERFANAVIRARLFRRKLVCNRLRRVFDKRCIQEEQRLRRDNRARSTVNRRARVGVIKRAEEPKHRVANDREIDTAAHRVVPRSVAGLIVGDVIVIAGGEQRSAHGAIKCAGDCEHRIPDGLGLNAATREARQQTVVGIGRRKWRVRRTRLSVRRARHDVAMHRFHAVAVRDKLAREEIKQLGMRGFRTKHAEVRRRVDEAHTEVPCPNSVHRHARGQRIFGVRHPACEFKPSALIVGKRRAWNDALEYRRHGTRDFLADRLRVIAAIMNRRFVDFGFLHNECARKGTRAMGVMLGTRGDRSGVRLTRWARRACERSKLRANRDIRWRSGGFEHALNRCEAIGKSSAAKCGVACAIEFVRACCPSLCRFLMTLDFRSGCQRSLRHATNGRDVVERRNAAENP